MVGESLVIGLIGGAVGIGLGFAGSALVGAFAPTLTASVGQTTGGATPGGARSFGGPPGGFGGGVPAGLRRLASDATTTVHVPMTATVTIGAVVGGCGTGTRRRPARGRVRRLAGGPAAARGGTGAGSNEPAEQEQGTGIRTA